MKIDIPKKHKKLLMNILSNRNSSYYKLLMDDIFEFDDKSINGLILELSDEFCEKGLKEDDEPNQIGIQIEELIDEINHCRNK